MKMEKSIAGTWNRWIRDNPQLVRYDLANSYPPPLSIQDALDCYPDSETLLYDLGNEPLDYGPETGPGGLLSQLAKCTQGQRLRMLCLHMGRLLQMTL